MIYESDYEKVLVYPDPRLRRVAKAIEEVSPEVVERVEKMFEIMAKDRGIGLAAPQIGWDVRLFVVNVTGQLEDKIALINPEVTERFGQVTMEEGCLSLPNIWAKVERPRDIVISGTTPGGEEVHVKASGLVARCLLHELDHLDGILFIDRVTAARKRRLKKLLKGLKEDFKKKQEKVSV